MLHATFLNTEKPSFIHRQTKTWFPTFTTKVVIFTQLSACEICSTLFYWSFKGVQETNCIIYKALQISSYFTTVKILIWMTSSFDLSINSPNRKLSWGYDLIHVLSQIILDHSGHTSHVPLKVISVKMLESKTFGSSLKISGTTAINSVGETQSTFGAL